MLYGYLKTTNGVNIVLQEDIQIYEFVWERVIVYNSVLFILFICIYYEYFAPLNQIPDVDNLGKSRAVILLCNCRNAFVRLGMYLDLSCFKWTLLFYRLFRTTKSCNRETQAVSTLILYIMFELVCYVYANNITQIKLKPTNVKNHFTTKLFQT